jgi:putative membrane protein
MQYNPYIKYKPEALTLNDHLAIDRTILANERTLLAFARTSIATLVVGGSCIKFFESPWMRAVGGLFVLISVLIAILGWRRYIHTRRRLGAALERRTGSSELPLKEAVAAQKSTPKAEPPSDNKAESKPDPDT